MEIRSCRDAQLLTPYCIISQNGHTHFKNIAANAARLVKCV